MNTDIGAALVKPEVDEDGLAYQTYYNKKVPAHFNQEGDDQLMKSLITKYSVEGNTNGKPNGHFFLTKDDVHAASSEVVKTHMGFKGSLKTDYIA